MRLKLMTLFFQSAARLSIFPRPPADDDDDEQYPGGAVTPDKVLPSASFVGRVSATVASSFLCVRGK
jgi:hypothetical protein